MSISDGFDYTLRRSESLARNIDEISALHIGVVTAVSSSNGTVFVRMPAINETAALGPYRCMQPFNNAVTTPVKQTLSVTTGTVDGTSVVTDVSLSASTTSLSGVYGALVLPVVGDRVVVLLVNNSLDEGVVIGKL
jgi:hypothetical protein